jgi:nitrate/TMAO reductase-like tetraheme cytochrome c subunit
MSTIKPDHAEGGARQHLKNWLSLAGAVVALGSFFAFAFLVAIDAISKDGNPYLGILTYIIAPGFLILGLFLAFLGWWLQRRSARQDKAEGHPLSLTIDFSKHRDRRLLLIFGSGSVVFLLLTAFGSYQTYHFTESVEFCGKTCHAVMKPEFTSYYRSSHARVSCAECHIGSGASWYVKSKLSGAYQVYSTIFRKYRTPIPTPVDNLRPAQDTCERCHWPEKFTGNQDRSYEHFLSDRKNTPFTVRLLLHVGGGQSGAGPFGGIHWHMNVENKVEYFASDEKRQEIPWVRVRSHDGSQRVFRAPDFKGEPPVTAIRTMDCIDCHNRPAHVLQTANQGVEQAMTLGWISTGLPNIKRVSVQALTQDYATDEQAMKELGEILTKRFPEAPGSELSKSIEGLRKVYQANFFPVMKASWRAYPNNIGHKDWPGCFRCHDDKHVSDDSRRKIKSSDCSACHTLLAQGRGEQLLQLAPRGLEFKHPGGDLDSDLLCSDCHNGGIQGK